MILASCCAAALAAGEALLGLPGRGLLTMKREPGRRLTSACSAPFRRILRRYARENAGAAGALPGASAAALQQSVGSGGETSGQV